MQKQFLKQLSPNSTGIVAIDKPVGWTSHDVVARVRRVTGIKKVGHAGTLDPLASGLLIVLIGKAYTRQQADFMKLDKRYQVTAAFGYTTDSYDAEGLVTKQTDWAKTSQLNRQTILDAIPDFVGEITQTVPAFSAVKIKGEALYRKARRSRSSLAEPVDLSQLPQRIVSIYSFELLTVDRNDSARNLTASFVIHCSSGTYIRSLIHDLGYRLSVGATVTRLRRTAIGPYIIENALQLVDHSK